MGSYRQLSDLPHDMTFFSKLNGLTALHFWAAYPTPAHLRATTLEVLAKFFHEKSKRRLRTEPALQKARQILITLNDAPLTNLGLLAQAQGIIIHDLAQQMPQLKRSIEGIEAKLEKTIPATG